MFSLSRDNLRFDIFMLRLKRLYIALKSNFQIVFYLQNVCLKVNAKNVCIDLILFVSIRARIYASKNALKGVVWWKICLKTRKKGCF